MLLSSLGEICGMFVRHAAQYGPEIYIAHFCWAATSAREKKQKQIVPKVFLLIGTLHFIRAVKYTLPKIELFPPFPFLA
jgi:hypothetical protein